MKKDKYEKTTNLNLATFLYANEQPIVGINEVSKGQKEFTFINSERLEELIATYKFPELDDENLLVDVHKYEYSRRYLLDRINE
ncbi:hypothetical protein H0W91_03310 [Patescibacteria group bacterium]|nr:hypothetical protein [Patescibacteria group bacterium]